LLIALLFGIQNLLELFDIESIPREIFSRGKCENFRASTRPSARLQLRIQEVQNVFCYVLTKNFLMVQAPGFIRGINPKSKIENPPAPAFIRGVNLKSKI